MDGRLNLLFEQLLSKSVAERRCAIDQLSLQDSSSKSFKSWTMQILNAAGDTDDKVRGWAADSLETLGTPAPTFLPELIQTLSSGSSTQKVDGEILYWAATLIGRLGPAAFRSTDALIQVIEQSNYLPARERAVWALGRIGPQARQAAAILRQVASKGPPRLRRLAAEALESLRGMAA